jgi:hypothetical protein
MKTLLSPNDTVARTRVLALLERLIAIGMGLVEATHDGLGKPGRDMSALVLMFTQVSRGVRYAIALDMRLAKGEAARRPREAEVAAIVAALIGRVDWLLPDLEDEVEFELDDHLDNDELDEALGDVDEYEDVMRRPAGEVLGRICRDLGVEAAWEDGDWVIRAAAPQVCDA